MSAKNTGNLENGRKFLSGALIALAAGVFLYASSTIFVNLYSPDSQPEENSGPELHPQAARAFSPRVADTLTFLASAGKAPGGATVSAPLPGGTFEISGRYGWRMNPVTGRGAEFHNGLDIASAKGTPVLSILAGTVKKSYSDPYSGETVIIDHGDSLLTTYAHLSERLVFPGESVACGQRVGRVGYTGRATGPHLHLGVEIMGRHVDPADYLWTLMVPGIALK